MKTKTKKKKCDKIYKLPCALLAAALALLAGCAAAPAESAAARRTSSGAEAAPTPAPKTDSAATESGKAREITLYLPAEKAGLGSLMADLARLDGVAVRVNSPERGTDYAAGLEQALGGADAPDLFWCAGPKNTVLPDNTLFQDLLADEMGPALRALAGLAPEKDAFLDGASLYGLPLGYYCEGYLVNLRLMAALLGASDTARLEQDLTACSWEEWLQLTASIDSYLAKPGVMRITLNGRQYTTPAYRPQEARPVRGMFALADAGAGELMDAALGGVLGAAYGSLEELWQDSEEAQQLVMVPAFEALFGLLDLETMYMARTGGQAFRGVEYENGAAATGQQALEQLKNGTALAIRGDSRSGAAIYGEDPMAAQWLTMVPLKLPPPDVEAAAAAVEQARAGTDEEATWAAERALYLSEALVGILAENNRRLWYASDGYLCIGAGSAAAEACEAVLLRLYTTPAGREGIWEAMQLHPYTTLYPADGLQALIQRVAALDEGNLLPAQPEDFKVMEAAIGGHVLEELMTKAEWDEEDAYAFVNQCLGAFGLAQLPPRQEE